jgi:hypothetical protein
MKTHHTIIGAALTALVTLNLQAAPPSPAEAQAAANTTRIAESLEDVKAALAVALARLDELEKAQKPTEEPAAEPEAAPVESKPSKKAQKAEPAEAEAETEA